MAAPAWPLTYSHLWLLTINNRQIFAMILLSTVWKRSKYGVFSGRYFVVFSPNMGEYGPEETPYLDTFHSVQLLSEMQNDFSGKRPITGKSLSSFELIISKVFDYTTWKVSKYGVFLVRIFPYLDWIRRFSTLFTQC